MLKPEVLRVRANAAVRVAVTGSPVPRYVGWTHVGGDEWKCDESAIVEVPNTTENWSSVRDGDLVAADSETAAWCGVKFTAAKAATKRGE